MCFSRRVRLLLIVIAAGALASVETRKPIYRIHRYCKATSEYSPIRSIGLTLIQRNPLTNNTTTHASPAASLGSTLRWRVVLSLMTPVLSREDQRLTDWQSTVTTVYAT